MVLDANIFFDLDDPSRNGADESQGLQSDWLRAAVRLCLTDEIRNEIHRNPDPVVRERRRGCAASYEFLECAIDDYRAIEPSVREIFGEPKGPADTSDIRHLARAIAAQATSFVTRDHEILSHADNFYSQYGLSVLRPAELIGRVEELRNGKGLLSTGTPSAIDHQENAKELRCRSGVNLSKLTSGREKTKSLEQRLRSYAADPNRFACYLIEAETPPEPSKPLALYVIEQRAAVVAAGLPSFAFVQMSEGPEQAAPYFAHRCSPRDH